MADEHRMVILPFRDDESADFEDAKKMADRLMAVLSSDEPRNIRTLLMGLSMLSASLCAGAETEGATKSGLKYMAQITEYFAMDLRNSGDARTEHHDDEPRSMMN